MHDSRRGMVCAAMIAGLAVQVFAAEVILPATAQAAGLSESAKREAAIAIDRATKWLVANQKPDGSWSNPDFPALTALPLWALCASGAKKTEVVDKAVKFILSHAHADGSIYVKPAEDRKGGGLKNYNTSLCMVALHATGRPEVTPVVQKARTFVAGGQHFGGDVYDGGMGYDAESGKAYADLSNSYIAYEAMRLTRDVEDLRKQGDPQADLDWAAAQKFLETIQNAKPGDAPSEFGGFGYTPEESKAGTYTNAGGAIRFRSYGSMTYAGLLSFIYAEVGRDDKRVASAHDWATKHWTLDENPGMKQQGYYYFLNVLSKGLAAYGQDIITLPDGRKVNWREELINKLINLQKTENGMGYWINEANRWQEGDPVLVTSYAVIALEIALGSR